LNFVVFYVNDVTMGVGLRILGSLYRALCLHPTSQFFDSCSYWNFGYNMGL